MAAIQQLGLLLGHPVYAVSAVLVIFLACSGAGSLWSDRLPPARAGRACAIVAVVLGLAGLCLLGVVHGVMATALPFRMLAAVGCLGPLAFLMGMPFPLGARQLAPGSASLAWAWASNGFASVVAAPLSALVALELGSRTLFAFAAAAYGVAATLLALRWRGRPRQPSSPLESRLSIVEEARS